MALNWWHSGFSQGAVESGGLGSGSCVSRFRAGPCASGLRRPPASSAGPCTLRLDGSLLLA